MNLERFKRILLGKTTEDDDKELMWEKLSKASNWKEVENTEEELKKASQLFADMRGGKVETKLVHKDLGDGVSSVEYVVVGKDE